MCRSGLTPLPHFDLRLRQILNFALGFGGSVTLSNRQDGPTRATSPQLGTLRVQEARGRLSWKSWETNLAALAVSIASVILLSITKPRWQATFPAADLVRTPAV
jgi:hypothetical protein